MHSQSRLENHHSTYPIYRRTLNTLREMKLTNDNPHQTCCNFEAFCRLDNVSFSKDGKKDVLLWKETVKINNTISNLLLPCFSKPFENMKTVRACPIQAMNQSTDPIADSFQMPSPCSRLEFDFPLNNSSHHQVCSKISLVNSFPQIITYL